MTWLRHRLPLLASGAAAAVVLAPIAAAQPGLPDPPPYIPGAPLPDSGSYSYPYNVIPVGPPPSNDSRGTRVAASVDSQMGSTGLPGSQLGNAEQQDGPLVTSNSRYMISGGSEPAGSPAPGINVGAGVTQLPSASKDGAPPTPPPVPESTAPGTLPGNPMPILETPGTPREGVLGVEGPPLA